MLWIIPALLAIVFIGILVWGGTANATSDVACIIGIIVFFSGVISCISLLIICANIEETLHKEFIDSYLRS